MYRAVIFDLDGTLLNTIDDLAAAGNHVLRVLGFAPHSVERYKQMVGNGIPKLVERFLPESARGAASQELALRLFLQHYGAHKADATAPYAGIPALLQALRAHGVLLGVVSNKEDTLAKEVIEQYFPGVFDAVAGHVPGTAPKPDPARVNAVRAAFGTQANETLYAGDSDVDIFTAHAAGLPGCGVLWGFRGEDELAGAGADFLAHAPQDIFTLACCGKGVEYVDGCAVPQAEAGQYIRLRAHCAAAAQDVLRPVCAAVRLCGRGSAGGEAVVGLDAAGTPMHRVPLDVPTVLAMGEAIAKNALEAFVLAR